MGKWLGIASLFGLLGLALWVVYEQWMIVVVDIPPWGWIAIILGVVVSLAVGFGLMALMFYSSREGYDDAPQQIERKQD